MDGLSSIPWAYLGLAFAMSLAISAMGFRRVDYFVSLGYAFSIVAQALVFPFLYPAGLDIWTVLVDVLYLAYGLRLGLFLLQRDRAPSFAREQKASLERGRHIKGWVKFAIWVSVAALYVAMYAPAQVLLANAAAVPDRTLVVVGLVVMVLGLGLEALADWQKSAFKARSPDRFCDAGLFRIVRSPNYFGEMVFWLGGFIASLGHFHAPLDWVLALIGLVCIELIMLGSARRLEFKQAERYGRDPAYAAYARRVPVIIPLLPIHSLRNLKVYLG